MKAVVAFLALAAMSSLARAETLVTSLSSHRLLINSNYTGSSIAIFGAIERDAQTVSRAAAYDVVVTVRGPRQSLVVREKKSLGPFWINQEQQKFPTAPAYLGVFSSRSVDDITTPLSRQRQRVGLDAIVNAPDFTLDRADFDEPFREALVRLKRREGLYLENDKGVAFLTPTIFRTAIPLPATAPPGSYDVEVALFSDTAVLAQAYTNFELAKTGFENNVGLVARDHALLYGLGTALMALAFGYLATLIFRRD